MPNDNLFFMVMEAEGDEMAAFDENAMAGDDAGGEDVAPPATDETGGSENVDDTAPEFSEDDFDMGGLGDATGDENSGGDEMSGDEGNGEEEADQKDDKLSTKANDILNQQLYTKFVARNKDIEGIIGARQEHKEGEGRRSYAETEKAAHGRREGVQEQTERDTGQTHQVCDSYPCLHVSYGLPRILPQGCYRTVGTGTLPQGYGPHAQGFQPAGQPGRLQQRIDERCCLQVQAIRRFQP